MQDSQKVAYAWMNNSKMVKRTILYKISRGL